VLDQDGLIRDTGSAPNVIIPNPMMLFTTRQAEVLAALAEGLTAAEVGRRLGISRRTVEDHLAAAKKVTGAKTSVEAVARCYCYGLLRPGVWPPAISSLAELSAC
jgi:DNA-binding CsgD family transcriptional regulator